MKKLYHVNLDEEKVEEVKKWLTKRGQSFSGYVNVIIGEIFDTIVKIDEDKKNTVNQCVGLLNEAAEKLEDVKAGMQKKVENEKGQKRAKKIP